MKCKYVSEFEFPSEAGFTGSAGKTMVKGYSRGGKSEVSDMSYGGSYSRGGKNRAKKALKNEKAEMRRVKMETEMERKDAGEEMRRVRSEERVDMAKLKAPRKRYPTNRSEPLIQASRGGKMK